MLPWLSKAAVDTKEQEYHQCLATIEGELADLAKICSNKDDIAHNDVGKMGDMMVG
jgi:hypothetical protein